MNEETKKIELTEQELDQVAGGMRKAGATVGNNKDNTTEKKGNVVRATHGETRAEVL